LFELHKNHTPQAAIPSPALSAPAHNQRDYTSSMASKLTTSYLEDSLIVFRSSKNLAERAMEQVTDQQLFIAIDEEANSIAIIVKHMAGNMRSCWTDFLTTDGEKPNRNRDTEFFDPPATRKAIM